MRSQIVAVAAVILLAPGAFAADRPVTDDERARLAAAVAAQGCSGGEMEFDDDGYYEVSDARCTDGRAYDLKFDASYKLIAKELDD